MNVVDQQIGLFDTDNNLPRNMILHDCVWKLFVDGASRNNPGSSAAGVVLQKNDMLVRSEGFFLGIKTNNQAEYFALVLGLLILKQDWKVGQSVLVVSDSLLLVRQLQGTYRVRHAELRPLFDVALALMKACNATIKHVLRAFNTQADDAANKGLDEKVPVPELYKNFLREHGIFL